MFLSHRVVDTLPLFSQGSFSEDVLRTSCGLGRVLGAADTAAVKTQKFWSARGGSSGGPARGLFNNDGVMESNEAGRGPDSVGKARFKDGHNLLSCAPLDGASQGLHFLQVGLCRQPYLEQVCWRYFPTVCVHFMSLCHMLVITGNTSDLVIIFLQ